MNKKDFRVICILAFIASITQFLLGLKHLEFGFFTDDWLFLSAYRAYIQNPILDFFSAWKELGPHWFPHSYYIGVLYNFFGLNYSLYSVTNQFLKIIASISLYPLVLTISKSRLLAFLSTLFFSIHYSPFGSLDNASRGEDFIAIASMNLFLTTYIYVVKKNISRLTTILILSIWMLVTIVIDPTRLFPLMIILPLIELVNLFRNEFKNQFKISTTRLLILYSPLLLLFLFSPRSIIVSLLYPIALLDILSKGNYQLFLSPFASLGSTYIPREFWIIFGVPNYEDFYSFFSYFLLGPLFLYSLFDGFLAALISKKPFKFFIRCFGLNIILGLAAYLLAHNWLYLDKMTRAPVDPGVFMTPALIGLMMVSLNLVFLWEWKESNVKNNLLPLAFIAITSSFIFIFLTWVFADFNSIFMGVHAYLNIPSIGTSIVIAILLVLIFERIKLDIDVNLTIPLLLVAIFIGFYFKISSSTIDEYFSYWLFHGLRATDQQRVWNQFWREINTSRNYNKENLPLIYFGQAEENENGAYYEQVIIWRLASWFDLKENIPKEKRFQLCNIEILGKEELERFVAILGDGETIVSTKCGENVFKKENFHAFRFKGRNLVPNTKEILQELYSNQANLLNQ